MTLASLVVFITRLFLHGRLHLYEGRLKLIFTILHFLVLRTILGGTDLCASSGLVDLGQTQVLFHGESEGARLGVVLLMTAILPFFVSRVLVGVAFKLIQYDALKGHFLPGCIPLQLG